MKLQSRLLMLLVPILVLAILGLGITAFVMINNSSEKLLLRQMANQLDQMQAHIDSHVRTAHSNVELMSNTTVLKQYLLEPDEEVRYGLYQIPLLDLFASYHQTFPEYYEMRVILFDGYEDARFAIPSLANTTEEEAQSLFFQTLSESESDRHAQIYFNPDNAEHAIAVGKRLILSDIAFESGTIRPRLRGYLVLTILPDFIQQQIDDNQLGQQGLFFVVNAQGRVLYHPTASERGKLLEQDVLAQIFDKAGQSKVWQQLYEQNTWYWESRPLLPNLWLVAGLPVQDIYALGQELIWLTGGILMLTMMALVGLLFWVLRLNVTQPLEQLSRATQQIRSGNFSVQLPLHNQDEIGGLSQDFQHMVQSLEQSQRALTVAKETAEEANQTKTRFLANMSHEIRTPLNAIVGFSQILQTQSKALSLPQKFTEYLEDIYQGGQHLSALISDILDFSKIESGKMEIVEEDILLNAWTESIFQINQGAAQHQKVHFTFMVDSQLPSCIRTDRTKLNQIAMNLVGNALKFTPAGRRVELRAKHLPNSQPAQWLLEVWDEGIGIPPERLHTIFDAFEQVDNTSTRSYEGTGLGLAITQQLVALLKGSIHVETHLGVGSTFQVTLPLIEGIPLTVSASPESESFTFASDNVILIVEDNLINQKMIEALFRSLDLKVHLALNGEIGVEKALSLHPDLVLMDIHMPKMDGLEATQHIRSALDESRVPIVALSADAHIQQLQQARDAGFSAYLTKPVKMNQLLPILKQYLRPTPL